MLSGYIPTPFVVNDELLISFRAYNCLSEDKAVTFAVWYYDANKKNEFEVLFKDTYIGKNPTSLKNT